MGFFKSEEEKQAKREEKLNNIMAKYELNNLDDKYKNAVKNINVELTGTGMMELGNMLSFDEKTAARLNTYYINALIQQNWIIIRQLNDLICSLKSINESSSSSNNNTSAITSIDEDEILSNLISKLENEKK